MGHMWPDHNKSWSGHALWSAKHLYLLGVLNVCALNTRVIDVALRRCYFTYIFHGALAYDKQTLYATVIMDSAETDHSGLRRSSRRREADRRTGRPDRGFAAHDGQRK